MELLLYWVLTVLAVAIAAASVVWIVTWLAVRARNLVRTSIEDEYDRLTR